MKILLAFCLIYMVNAPSYARLDFEDHAFPELVTSARALAMGNAYINKVDDSWAAFYNPAGLGTVRQPQLHLFNAHLEASSGLMNVIGGGPAYKIPSNYMDTRDQSELKARLATEQGKIIHSRFNFFPNFTVRGLTLGYLISQRDRAILNNDVANEFEVAERNDQGPVMSLNASLFGGVFKVGATAVYLNRKELYKVFSPSDPVVMSNADYKKGSSLQVTAGARLTLPVTLLPAFSAVLRNATKNDFEDTQMGGAPEEIKQTLDLGFSLTPQISKMSRVHMEVNVKDANDSYNTDFKRRVTAGLELDFNRRIFLRTGYGDGWGSGGLGIRSRTFILDLTTYAVDKSNDGFREEEDRRWVFSFSSGF